MKRFILLCIVCLCMGMGLQVEAVSSEDETFYGETSYGETFHGETFNGETFNGETFNGETFYEDGDVVGFIGDSITHATYLPASYVDVLYLYYLSRFPQREVEFRNLAAAGYKAIDILNIYDLDPAFRGVNKVVIMLGTNEAILEVSPEDYINNMGELVRRLQEDGLNGKDILILSPPICDQNCTLNYKSGGRPRWNFEGRLLEYMDMLEVKTAEWGVGYVDLHTPMAELTEEMQRADRGNTLTTDCIHPNAAGQILLAYYILQAQGGTEPETAHGILVTEGGEARSVGDEIWDFYRGEKGISWTWKPELPPMAVYGELTQIPDISKSFADFFHETIRVEGLSEEASYRVLMGEDELGTFTGQELLDGMIPTMSENHPQRINLQQMNDWNRQRHKNAVRYRNIWVEIAMQRAVYDPGTIQSAYEKWRAADEELRNKMSAMAQDMADMIYSVNILEEGYSAAELAQDKKEAEEQAEREARERAEREAREQAEREAREQAEREAREQAEREAREQAEREAREQAEREAAEAQKAAEARAKRKLFLAVALAGIAVAAVVALAVFTRKRM